jgi:DNA-3-methyladenine glycosylase
MKKQNILPEEFFDRPTPIVAEELLGKFLVRQVGDMETAVMITEVEVYDGFADKASHAFRVQTPRTAGMFSDPGVWYVYLVYGMYEMLNIVTREKNYPAAILIRGVEGYNGPGKLTKALDITRLQNGKRAVQKTKLWIEDREVVIAKKAIARTPRIGVAYAGPIWSGKQLRFILKSRSSHLP